MHTCVHSWSTIVHILAYISVHTYVHLVDRKHRVKAKTSLSIWFPSQTVMFSNFMQRNVEYILTSPFFPVNTYPKQSGCRDGDNCRNN